MTNKALNLRYKNTESYQGYTVSCGYTLSAKGQKRQKDWYLGNDQSKAMQLYLVIQGEWKNCQGKGNPIWTAESIEKVQEFKQSLYGSNSVKLPTPPVILEPAKITFYQLIDEYIAHVIPTVIGSDIWRKDLSKRVNYLKRCSPDFPIEALNHQKITEMVSFWKNRPSNIHDKDLKNKDKPISVNYVGTMIKSLLRFLTWLDESEKWQSFKGWQKILRLQGYKPKLTDTEILAQSKNAVNVLFNDRFSIEELQFLYQSACPQTKKYMLLALNCGFTQGEISSLMEGEIYLNQDPPIIARARIKTTKINKPIVSKWILWNETVDAIKDLLSTDSPDLEIKDSILQGHRTGKAVNWNEIGETMETNWLFGKPLIYFNENHTRIDLIRNNWFRLFDKLPKGKVRQLGFKYLRKTGSDMIKEIADENTAQMYLSHTPSSVGGKHYYNPDYPKLFLALIEMRKQLEPMFQPLPKEKKGEILDL